jgi:hypothetical protein
MSDITFLPAGAAQPEREPDRQEIAELAYQYWQHRGCPNGSSDEDWYRAEQALRDRSRFVATAEGLIAKNLAP